MTTSSNRRASDAQEQLFAPGTSSRAKYSALVVGRPGLGALLKYELVVSLAQARAGALGLALRKLLYPMLLGSCGRNVVFGQNVVLRHPHKIHIGNNVVVDDHCLLDAKGETNRGIRIGDGVFIGRNTILSCKNGDIELADGANLGFNCEVFSASRVTIGKSVLMAAYATSSAATTISPTRPSRCSSSSASPRASPSATAPGWARAPRFSTASRSATAP